MITAWTNDVDFDSLFSRQIEGLGSAGDVLVALSTSGNSSNIIKAVKISESIGVQTIIMTGKSGGSLASMGNVRIMIPSEDTQRIQEGHITAGHIFCELVERAFIPEN